MSRLYDWLRPWRRTERLLPLPGDERPCVFYALMDATWPSGSRLVVTGNECWLEHRRWRWSMDTPDLNR